MWRRWSFIRSFKLQFLRFARLNGTPDDIAKGMALGIFIGMTPTLGFQMAIAIFLAWLLRENKIAAAAGVWITNPVTAPFIYALEYETGRVLLQMPRFHLPTELSYATLRQLGWDVVLPLCFGSLLYAIASGAIAYSLTLRMIPIVRQWHIPRWPRPRKRN
jgi:uncharacterized protein (DUF2062 family)